MSNDVQIASISVDLDSMACYREIHGLDAAKVEGADAAYAVGVDRLLGFFDELGLKSTLFVVGKDAENPAHHGLLKDASAAGHELANHSWAHDYAMRKFSEVALIADFERAEEVLVELSGQRPRGFRAPGYNVDSRLINICERRGYAYDSSVFPCPSYYTAKGAVMGWLKVRGRPSRSSMTRAEALIAPVHPYHPDPQKFWRRGNAKIVEVPMAVTPGTRLPIIGTSLHLLKAKGFDIAFAMLRRTHPFLNLEFHAIDFMDDSDPGVEFLRPYQPDLQVPWAEKKALYKHVFSRVNEDYDFDTLINLARAAREK